MQFSGDYFPLGSRPKTSSRPVNRACLLMLIDPFTFTDIYLSLFPLQMLSNSYEDFVMTPIKCPPPKIVAVTRSLKGRSLKKNIMDDDEVSNKDDFINDDDSLSSFDAKDLIEFERDEPLIDLSDDVPPAEQGLSTSRDTVTTMNARNSSTLLSLLDMLEIGSVSETARNRRCAQDAFGGKHPFVSKTSSSSSLQNIPVECPGACATSSGKTDKLSTVFPPLSNQPENPSIVKNYGHHSEILNRDDKDTLRLPASDKCDVPRVRDGIDLNFIDSQLQNSHQCQSEKSNENFASTSISFPCSRSDCSIKSCCCTKGEPARVEQTNRFDSAHKEKENFSFCHNQQQLTKTAPEQSDTNNNRESVCNQNSVDESLSLSHSEDDESLKFLSPHTSQRKLPPKFYNSTSSLNQDCFEASSRLKRLEERFKGFSYTKKLLRSSKLFSKSEEILSSYGKEFKSCESLNPTVQFPLSSTTLSENCLRQLTDEGEAQEDYRKDRRTSLNNEIAGECREVIKR